MQCAVYSIQNVLRLVVFSSIGGQEYIYQEFIVEAEGGATCQDILGVMRHLSLDTGYVLGTYRHVLGHHKFGVSSGIPYF